MKILHLTTFLQGGAGRAIVSLAVAQHRAGCDVTVVTSNIGAPGYGNYSGHLDDLRRAGVPVHLVDSTFVRSHHANLQVVQALDRLFPDGEEPSVIHAHAAIPSLAGLVFAGSRRRDMAVVQTMHGWGVAKTPEQETTDLAILSLLDRVVVPSAHAAGEMIARGVDARRISHVPNGVADGRGEDDSPVRPLLRRMRDQRRNGVFVVACIGTIGWRKNQELLVDAVARFGDAPPVRCVFVGDGDTTALSNAIARSGRAGDFEIHGYTPAARRIAAEADVLVLPSRSEGQPLSVLEAFADGALVLVSDVPELAELVDDGVTGVRFAAEDATALASALRRMASMSERERAAMAARARSCYLTCFTLDLMAANYFSIYRDVLRGRAARVRRPSTLPAA